MATGNYRPANVPQGEESLARRSTAYLGGHTAPSDRPKILPERRAVRLQSCKRFSGGVLLNVIWRRREHKEWRDGIGLRHKRLTSAAAFWACGPSRGLRMFSTEPFSSKKQGWNHRFHLRPLLFDGRHRAERIRTPQNRTYPYLQSRLAVSLATTKPLVGIDAFRSHTLQRGAKWRGSTASPLIDAFAPVKPYTLRWLFPPSAPIYLQRHGVVSETREGRTEGGSVLTRCPRSNCQSCGALTPGRSVTTLPRSSARLATSGIRRAVGA